MSLALKIANDKQIRIKVDPLDYLHIAEIVARKFCKHKEDIKDSEIYGEACLALIKIANKGYNPAIRKFSSLAFQCIENHLISYIRKKKAKKRTAKFENLDKEQWREIKEISKQFNDTLPANLLDKFLQINTQDSEQDKIDKKLLKEVYLEKNKIGKIAAKYDVSRMTIYTWLNRIINKIRTENPDLMKKYYTKSA